MLNFLKGLLLDYVGHKLLRFLVEVFSDKTGEVLDEHYKVINKWVKKTEEIADYIDELIESDTKYESITGYVKFKYDDKFSFFDIEDYFVGMESLGKFRYAYDSICKELIAENKNFTEQAIRLGIELAVNRFYGKK